MRFVENLKIQISKQEKIKNTLIPALGDKPCKYFGILVDIQPDSPFVFFETFSFIFNDTYNIGMHSCWKHSNNTDQTKSLLSPVPTAAPVSTEGITVIILMCIVPDCSLNVHAHLYLYIQRDMVLFLGCLDVLFFNRNGITLYVLFCPLMLSPNHSSWGSLSVSTSSSNSLILTAG